MKNLFKTALLALTIGASGTVAADPIEYQFELDFAGSAMLTSELDSLLLTTLTQNIKEKYGVEQSDDSEHFNFNLDDQFLVIGSGLFSFTAYFVEGENTLTAANSPFYTASFQIAKVTEDITFGASPALIKDSFYTDFLSFSFTEFLSDISFFVTAPNLNSGYTNGYFENGTADLEVMNNESSTSNAIGEVFLTHESYASADPNDTATTGQFAITDESGATFAIGGSYREFTMKMANPALGEPVEDNAVDVNEPALWAMFLTGLALVARRKKA